MDAELLPGEDLDQLLERADPARQGHERVRELGHQRLALVHRLHDVQLGQAAVGDLAVHELLRDHADDLAAGLQRGVGQRAHQADRRAAVDDADAAADERPREVLGRLQVDRVRPEARAAVDADGLHSASSSRSRSDSSFQAPTETRRYGVPGQVAHGDAGLREPLARLLGLGVLEGDQRASARAARPCGPASASAPAKMSARSAARSKLVVEARGHEHLVGGERERDRLARRAARRSGGRRRGRSTPARGWRPRRPCSRARSCARARRTPARRYSSPVPSAPHSHFWPAAA